MNAKTRQPRGNEPRGRRVVVGRVVFSFNAQVLKVIDLDETDIGKNYLTRLELL